MDRVGPEVLRGDDTAIPRPAWRLEVPQGDDTMLRVVSSKTGILGRGGPEMSWGDDTMRHVVSSKSGNIGRGAPEVPWGDDTMRHVVSSKTGILGHGGSKCL